MAAVVVLDGEQDMTIVALLDGVESMMTNKIKHLNNGTKTIIWQA
jgi:uncharacterized protein YegL